MKLKTITAIDYSYLYCSVYIIVIPARNIHCEVFHVDVTDFDHIPCYYTYPTLEHSSFRLHLSHAMQIEVLLSVETFFLNTSVHYGTVHMVWRFNSKMAVGKIQEGAQFCNLNH